MVELLVDIWFEKEWGWNFPIPPEPIKEMVLKIGHDNLFTIIIPKNIVHTGGKKRKLK